MSATVVDVLVRFGKTARDELLLLAPLYQCCVVRLSTVSRLLAFYRGPHRLSDLMRLSLTSDPLDPILTETQLTTLDRRVAIILEEVYKCTLRSSEPVIIDDVV